MVTPTHCPLRVPHAPLLAGGVYKAARDLFRSNLEDLSVVGIDDSMIARMLGLELTSVAIPTTVSGEQAVHLLLTMLEKEIEWPL